jgi:asparagine synthetase B (glutamine-hydrolysing)
MVGSQSGMGLTINTRGERSQELLWDVASFHGDFIKDENSFEEELLATLKSCTKAWAHDASGVCVELSGGADSSGLMLLLNDVLPKNKKLIAVNYMDSKTPSSNEIKHAQEVANACDTPLHFIDWQNTSILDKLPQDFLPNKPSLLLLYSKMREELREVHEKIIAKKL